jgi:hypothetical protein
MNIKINFFVDYVALPNKNRKENCEKCAFLGRDGHCMRFYFIECESGYKGYFIKNKIQEEG